MQYKPSNYNIFIPTGNSNEIILYNSLHDSILLVDEETESTIKHDLDSLKTEEKELLGRLGILVPEEIDEFNVLRLKYNKIKYNTGFYSLFVILPTFACNLKCSYCYEGSGEILKKNMDKKTQERVVNFVKKQTILNKSKEILIKIYGGEPLLNYPILLKLCKELFLWTKENNIGFNLLLQTNGTLLSEDRIKELKPYLSGVELTLDGTKHHHDDIRIFKNGKPTYDIIMETIDHLLENEIETIVRLNVEDDLVLSEVLDELTTRGLRARPNFFFYTARVSDYSLCQFFSNNELCQEDQEFALSLSPELQKVMVDKGWKMQHNQPDILQKQKFVACNNEKAGRYTIDPWGNIFTCFFRAGDEEYKAGTLTDFGVKWTSIYYNMITRDATSFNECKKCEYFPFCGGGCSMRAYVQKGTFATNHCGSIKELMPQRILTYLRKKYPEKFPSTAS